MEKGAKSMGCENEGKLIWVWRNGVVVRHATLLRGWACLKKWTTQKKSGRPRHRTSGMQLLAKGRKVGNGQSQAFKNPHIQRMEWMDDCRGINDGASGVRRSRSVFPLSEDDSLLISLKIVEPSENSSLLFSPPNQPPTCICAHWYSFPPGTWNKWPLLICAPHLCPGGCSLSPSLGLSFCNLPLFFVSLFFHSLQDHPISL